MDNQVIGIIGSGTMGSSIVQVAAQKGFKVILIDVKEDYVKNGFIKIKERLEKSVSEGKLENKEKNKILSNIKISTNLFDCNEADLIIEAAIENENIKRQIFIDLNNICSEKTVFASNTSSISITRLAHISGRPHKFAGMHFMNPAHIMKLIEVIPGPKTSDDTLKIIMEISKKLDKLPVIVKDNPGFILNRVLIPMINDAIYCLQEGLASRENIDTIMKLGANYPMGALELADFIGLYVCLSILDILQTDLGEKYRPCLLLRKMVDSGNIGKKSGEGFYKYK